MDRISLPGPPPVEVALKVSKRARRLTLRVTPQGAATLTRPPWVPASEAAAFARARAGWLAERVGEGPRRPRIGGTVPLEGRDAPVLEGRRRIEHGALHVPAGAPGPAVARLLKDRARVLLTQAAGRHAAALGRPHGRISMRDTRSRWGSCAASGNLSFSWRLAMAPPEVLDYVAAHEVAHLAHMDHSRAYWAQVAALMPGFEAPRRWLKADGRALMAWDFS